MAASVFIPLVRGDRVEIWISSSECAKQGNTISVSGVLSGVVSTNACYEPGKVVALGPTTASGNLTISGTGEFQLQGTYPRFIVQFEDGRDFDWNDVVMEVRIIPADCDPILKDPRVLPSLQQLMSQSKWDQPFAQRQEQGGYLVLDPTGNPGLIPFVVNSAGPCHIDRDWESQEQQLRGSGNTIVGSLNSDAVSL